MLVLMQWQNRERVEQAMFVLVTQLLVLTCLLHLSFVSPHGHADCLGGYLPPETQGSDQFRLLRVQVRERVAIIKVTCVLEADKCGGIDRLRPQRVSGRSCRGLHIMMSPRA